MVRTFLLCALAASAGCSFGDDRSLGGDGGGQDARTDGMTDGPMKEVGHLLISEIKSVGPAGTSAEFIEIWNPTNRSIELRNYYLADFADYWKLPQTPALTATDTDFSVGFPLTATIGSKQVVTVATNAAEYLARYTIAATYAVDATSGGQMMRDRRIGNGIPQITNAGEVVILYYWDGNTDLVQDVDIVLAGQIDKSSMGNRLNTKTSVDGPDADVLPSVYKTDSGLVGNGMSAEATDPTSYKRIALETGKETQTSTGNGLTGDDETSEILSDTWDAAATAPTPGVAPTI